MTLDELKKLKFDKIGSWPVLPKLGILLLLLLLLVFASYWFDWQDQIAQIDSAKAKEEQLRTTFLSKKKQAIDLPAYRKQLVDIESQFGALLKQLPGKSEMDALLTDINQAGLGRGLQFELFRPAANETAKDFYAELPITIRVTGNYHDLGAFASDIGRLSRIVTLNDIALSAAKDGLTLDATAKTFRYLDEAEIAAQKKKPAAGAKK
jgi:type IV pilus assembly protein PilO